MKIYESIYSIAGHARHHGLVIYGAGFWGKISYQIFSLFDVIPTFFCDDDFQKQGTFFCDGERSIPIVSLDEAAKQLPDAVYFSAATGNANIEPRATMNQRLRERGLHSEYSGFHPSRYVFLLDGGWEALGGTVSRFQACISVEDIKNMVVLSHMSNSGIVLFDTLMDGHPNILNVPGFGPRVPLRWIYKERLQFLQGKELALETASQMCGYFRSRLSEEAFQNSCSRIAENWYRNQNGERERRIYIDAFKFVSSLMDLLENRGCVSFAILIKAIFAAYANAIGKTPVSQEKFWILYERHQANYDVREMDDVLARDDFERLEYWFIIREPVQHLFSRLGRAMDYKGVEQALFFTNPAVYLGWIASDLGLMLERNERTKDKTIKIVRFEDVKLRTRETMRVVCNWMRIPFDKCMLETTANGIKIYFPTSGTLGKHSEVISAQDTVAVKRTDFSSLMSSYDIFRLNLAFQNFKRAYGYECDVPHYSVFSQEFLQELYRHPFRLESLFDNSFVKKAQDAGYEIPVEWRTCHGHIAKLLLDYMQEPKHELITDVLWPVESCEDE